MVMVAGMAMAVVAMPVAIAGNVSPAHAATSASVALARGLQPLRHIMLKTMSR